MRAQKDHFGSMILIELKWNYSDPLKGVSMIPMIEIMVYLLLNRTEPMGSHIKEEGLD